MRIDFEAVGDVMLVQGVVQLGTVVAQPVFVAHIDRGGAVQYCAQRAAAGSSWRYQRDARVRANPFDAK